MRRIASVLLLAVASAACVSNVAVEEHGAVEVAVEERVVVEGVGPGVEYVVPRPGTVDPHPVPFDRAEVHPEDDGAVTVFWQSGVEPCHVLDRVEIDLAPDAVTITVFEGTDPTAGAAPICEAPAVQKAVRLRLPEPVGGRALVDGADEADG